MSQGSWQEGKKGIFYFIGITRSEPALPLRRDPTFQCQDIDQTLLLYRSITLLLTFGSGLSRTI